MKAILTDITRCIGCDQCKEACYKQYNDGEVCLPSSDARDDLSETTWTTVVVRQEGRTLVPSRDDVHVSAEEVARDPTQGYVRKHCLHCLNPTCVSVCPVGAFHKDESTGAVVYDADKCIGCRYCMYACPFGIPRYEWGTAFPIVQKCMMCYERIQDGVQPACTEACSEGATEFGDRETLLAVAHDRIDKNPGRYLNHVYGEDEAGGTSVLYLTKPGVPLDFIFQKRVGVSPLPDYTHQWLTKVPSIGLGAALGVSGLFWTIRRRELLANGEAAVERNGRHAE